MDDMNYKLEENLSAAFSQMLPDDMYEHIVQDIDSIPERNVTAMKQQTNRKQKQKKLPLRWLSLAAAACLILVVGLWGGSYYQNNFVVDSIVDIDVNPSIELSTNRQDKVIDAVPVNEDAAEILGDMSLKNTDLNVAVNAIVGAMVQKGYFTEGENSILVTVQNQDQEKAQAIRNLVLSDIDTSLKSNQVEASIINQTVTGSTDAKSFAEAHNISLGKAAFVLNLAAKDSTLDADTLAAMSLTELANLVAERNIDISGIANYDADDSIWENISDAVEEVNEEGQVLQSSDLITPAEAKEIALADAGVSAGEATIIKTELDQEDGMVLYEVEFYASNQEYDYEIDAVTGKVYRREQEAQDGHYSETHNSAGHQAASGGQTSTTEGISQEKAKEIALNHAGVSETDTFGMEVELDEEDGMQVYEIEFCAGSMEYNYEIDAATGNILDYEQERDD